MFPRLYSLESQKSCKVSDRCIGPFSFNWAWRRRQRNDPKLVQYNSLVDLIREFSPSTSPGHWECSLDASKVYQVRYMRKKIDDFLLCSNDDVVRWKNTIPINFNIHSWRLSNDRLPTRCNLDAHGIDLDLTRCPLCDQGLEDAQHLFVDCSVASSVASNLWSLVKE
ncbi:reverse transcriptase domain, Reverse transcriptase zinc-binding domain protein [Artemisia annua]|uniref:Reverse transcriptase domain, Reverse transcriptase zinc-binding domain protein n=1 Tax=Artemisia annua TaxID=35608 RepID=A0A2U1NUQ8_ARTAN|nr:reverse transcriptase domain, Reverse transcriptase zinc-binding domain protein [Artemisia annua]